jgi:hypothetical protein
MTTIEANGAKLMKFAAEVDRAADSLSDDVSQVVKTVDVRQEFQEKLAPALERLKSLSSSVDEEMTESDSVNLDALFFDLEHCYTMDSERRVHRQFVAKDDHSPFAMAEEDEWTANRDHGLGDNIDLF